LREEYVIDRRAYAGAVNPADPIAGQQYFAETGHNLGGRFLEYWKANGGLAQFGYPITEVRSDSIDGGRYETQFFERARFEYHPENDGTPFEVLLGQFGRRVMAENALLSGDFGRLFQTDPAVQVNLGKPVSAAIRTNGAMQAFEKGRMFYAEQAPSRGLVQGGYLDRHYNANAAASGTAWAEIADTEPTIYALCGEAQRGKVFTDHADFRYFFLDTWDESQPSGGGMGPKAGLYEPKRGFGRVWRDREGGPFRGNVIVPGAHSCLGYATSADEIAFTITVQYFQGGVMLLSDTPEGRYLYVLAVGYYSNGGGPSGTYERYPLK
jgi:hypothetical protein